MHEPLRSLLFSRAGVLLHHACRSAWFNCRVRASGRLRWAHRFWKFSFWKPAHRTAAQRRRDPPMCMPVLQACTRARLKLQYNNAGCTHPPTHTHTHTHTHRAHPGLQWRRTTAPAANKIQHHNIVSGSSGPQLQLAIFLPRCRKSYVALSCVMHTACREAHPAHKDEDQVAF